MGNQKENVSRKGKADKSKNAASKGKNPKKKVWTTYPERVVSKDLNDRDYTVFKYFQGIKQAALKNLIFNTSVDTDENRDLFKRAFLLYIQKCFLLSTSAANITPRALPTIFNLENTRHQN
ncbi:hypothetical protein PIB30_024099 [Stylosanthes scabra]|uniref:40S ribosomal protein S25 n=1 Tax=Stylosanthes scabra TaxID=79078 RepID=A0ABU6U966_9FABA|nr:hypothetical protein [Stylosanthes scabra]